jgi:hypothetical protein
MLVFMPSSIIFARLTLGRKSEILDGRAEITQKV